MAKEINGLIQTLQKRGGLNVNELDFQMNKCYIPVRGLFS